MILQITPDVARLAEVHLPAADFYALRPAAPPLPDGQIVLVYEPGSSPWMSDGMTQRAAPIDPQALDALLAERATIAAEWAALHPPPEPEAQLYVSRLTIVDRLIAWGKLAEALAAIGADPVIQARWNAAIVIATDDPTARALCAAIGVDPEVILAPGL